MIIFAMATLRYDLFRFFECFKENLFFLCLLVVRSPRKPMTPTTPEGNCN